MRKKVLLPLLILIVTVVVTMGMLRMREQPEQSTPTEAVVLIETMTLSPVDTRISVQSQGTVEARTRTSLVSEVSGKVSEVASTFVTGGFFRKGEVLLRLDDSNYRAALSRSEAALATARSALALEQGQADVSQREWDRMSPEQQARISGKELYLRKPQLAEAQARLEAAEADLEEARRNLDRTSIVAPYDGLVSSKNSDIGQFVNAGTVLAETFAVDYAEVRLPIPETKLAFLDLPVTLRAEDDTSQGPEVELVSSMGNREYRWHGHLTRTEGVLDTRTRVLYSVVQVKDPYGLYGTERAEPLRIGTYVNAEIAGQELKGVYVLPRHTLQAGDLVWVADQENRLRARQVSIVTVNGDDAFVSEGLLPGDRVVITRMENPLNGMAVQTSTLYAPVN
jgi:RND family efflux transporter MFP subunit